MPNLALSANAVAVLRFEIRGYRSRVPGRRLPAYRELAAAGIMELVPGSEAEYRLTEDERARREELLADAEAHWLNLIPRLPDRVKLSEAARKTLRRHLSGDDEVSDANRLAYRELARAGIMTSVGTFTKGDDCVFRFTSRGWERRFEFAEMACARESA